MHPPETAKLAPLELSISNNVGVITKTSGRGGEMGPALKKNFSVISMLATCVSLMATWETLCSAMASGLVSGGPAALVYGSIVAFIGTICTGLSLSELASIYPTAGGQYHFAAELAPSRFRHPISYIAGWITVFGWQSMAASAPFLAGTMIQGLLVLQYETYIYQRWHGTLLYWAVLFPAAAINIYGSRILPTLQDAAMVLHVTLFVILLVVMVVVSPSKHSAAYVFTNFENNSGWSNDGLAWCIGLLSSCYVLTGYDAAIHLSEEMTNPAYGVPIAIVGSLLLNAVMGFAFLLAILFTMGDPVAAIQSATGFPIIEIFYHVTGNIRAASAMSSAVVVMAMLATIPLVASAARTLWALARDQGIPFSNFLAKVDGNRQIPTRAVLFSTIFLAILGLLNIASTTAVNAVLSLAVVGLYISYLFPIVLILYTRIKRPQTLQYGPWKLGKWGIAVNIISIAFTSFTSVVMLFPTYQPVTALNMNYSSVVLGGVLVLSLCYWLFKGRKSYAGPIYEIHGSFPAVVVGQGAETQM